MLYYFIKYIAFFKKCYIILKKASLEPCYTIISIEANL